MIRRTAERVYSLLLYAYPPAIRLAHADEMRQCARAALTRRGPSAIPLLAADLVISVPREWARLFQDSFPRGRIMTGIGRDVRYALRLLRRSPGFSAAAIVTLALGIGANTAIFTLADATVIRPLRVDRVDRLVAFKWSVSLPDYRDWAARTDVFTGVAGVAAVRVNVVVDEGAEPTDAALVSPNYFSVLGVGASSGRVLGAADNPAAALTAVIDRDWWRSRLSGDPAAVGRTIHVSGLPVTIVGIAEEGFRGTTLQRPPKLYMPLTAAAQLLNSPFNAPGALDDRGFLWLNAIGRLRDGVAIGEAAVAMNAVNQQQHPAATADDRVELQPLRGRALGSGGADSVQTFVALLLGVVALTLLIGCANLANLQLARAAARQREIGVRLAIGAGRGRIFRQLLTESCVLAVIGGALGLGVASLAIRLIARFQLPGGIDIATLPLGVNRTALAFAAIASAGTVLIFGLLPAWQAAAGNLLTAVRGESRVTARSRLRSALVSVQIALSLVLLAGTGLFLQSFAASLRVPLGFTPAGVATTTLTPAAKGFDRTRARQFFDDALVRVHRIPGVTAAAWTNVLPVNGSMSMDLTVDGYPKKPAEDMHVYVANVSPEYFAAAGIRLLKGRAFTDADRAGTALVAIVNETAARRFWAGRDPLDGHVAINDIHAIQIVGVVADTKIRSLDEVPAPGLYAPFAQPSGPFAMDRGTLLVRTSGDIRGLLPALRDQLRAVDPEAPLTPVNTFEWQVRTLVMPQRMGATFFGAFALLALTLASIGIYGVASYVAALRTREIGIRLALGADRASIRSLVLREGAVPVVHGLAGGLAVALAGSRFAAAFLRGVPPHDPATYLAVMGVLALAALTATWIPAQRAASVDPIRALRQE